MKSAACALGALVSLSLISLTFPDMEMYVDYLSSMERVNRIQTVDNALTTHEPLRQACNWIEMLLQQYNTAKQPDMSSENIAQQAHRRERQ